MANKILAIVALAFGFLSEISAQEAQYAVANISPSLLERAHATVRDESIDIDMRSTANMAIRIARTVTVHNKSGDEHGRVDVYYNKSRSIRRITGEIMDETGKTVQKFTMRDFKDNSASGQNNLYDDTRVKTYQPIVHHYPYTIRYEIEIRENQNLLVPRWAPDFRYDVSVERSAYRMTIPQGEEIRIHQANYAGEPNVVQDGKTKTYSWTLEAVAAKRSEPFSPPRDREATFVRIVPENFQYYKKKGSFSNWHEYGKWIHDQLLADKKTLPASTVAHLNTITATAKTPKDKARVLYQYLQEKTRYISIQIGIGGFEPFPASSVDQLGYGDCKALVIYMQSMLEAVGIPSYYCVVEAGPTKRDLTLDFANIQDGNHVILCIPFENDTTWLECTSQHLPFGFLGDFTDDRMVVACTPDGGKLLRTPRYSDGESLQYREATFTIGPDGTLTGSMETVFKGNQLDNHYRNMFQNPQEQRRNLANWYNVNGISFSQAQYETSFEDTLSVRESLELNIRNYVVDAGEFAILQPNIFNRAAAIPASRNRTNEVYINRGYTDIDVTHFTLPAGYGQNMKPLYQTVETPMATYELRISVSDRVLTSYRSFQLKEGCYPATSYQEFYEAMATIRAHDLIRFTIPLAGNAQ